MKLKKYTSNTLAILTLLNCFQLTAFANSPTSVTNPPPTKRSCVLHENSYASDSNSTSQSETGTSDYQFSDLTTNADSWFYTGYYNSSGSEEDITSMNPFALHPRRTPLMTNDSPPVPIYYLSDDEWEEYDSMMHQKWTDTDPLFQTGLSTSENMAAVTQLEPTTGAEEQLDYPMSLIDSEKKYDENLQPPIDTEYHQEFWANLDDESAAAVVQPEPTTDKEKSSEPKTDFTDIDEEDDKNIKSIKERMPGRKIICFCPKKLKRFSEKEFKRKLTDNGVWFTQFPQKKEPISRNTTVTVSSDNQKPIIYFGKNIVFDQDNRLSGYKIYCDMIIYGSTLACDRCITENTICGMAIIYKPRITRKARRPVRNFFPNEKLFVVGNDRHHRDTTRAIAKTNAVYLSGNDLLNDSYKTSSPVFDHEPSFYETLVYVLEQRKGQSQPTTDTEDYQEILVDSDDESVAAVAQPEPTTNAKNHQEILVDSDDESVAAVVQPESPTVETEPSESQMDFTDIDKKDIDQEDAKNIEYIKQKMPGRKIIYFCPKTEELFDDEQFELYLRYNDVWYYHNHSPKSGGGSTHSLSYDRDKNPPKGNKPIIYFGRNVIFGAYNTLRNYDISCDMIICESKLKSRYCIAANNILGKTIMYKPRISTDYAVINVSFKEKLFAVGDFQKEKAHYPIAPINRNALYLYGDGLLSSFYKQCPRFSSEPTFNATLDWVFPTI